MKKFIDKKLYKKDSSYEQWLKDFVKPLNSNELNQMEKEFSINNINYNPLKGA